MTIPHYSINQPLPLIVLSNIIVFPKVLRSHCCKNN